MVNPFFKNYGPFKFYEILKILNGPLFLKKGFTIIAFIKAM